MQIVSWEDSLYEMSKPVFWENLEKYCSVLIAENFTENAKHKIKHVLQFNLHLT